MKPPFSTTDTEPEMRECNLSHLDSRKKGAKKQVPILRKLHFGRKVFRAFFPEANQAAL
jgi:hypothetical protein